MSDVHENTLAQYIWEEGIYVRGSDGVSVPWNTKHAVAAGLDDDLVITLLDGFTGNNVIDSAIASVTSCDTLERCTIWCEHHSLAHWVKLDCDEINE